MHNETGMFFSEAALHDKIYSLLGKTRCKVSLFRLVTFEGRRLSNQILYHINNGDSDLVYVSRR